MPQLLHLEEFSTTGPAGHLAGAGSAHTGSPGGSDADTLRVAFYEQGYKAGWDDASRAANEEQTKFSAEFSHNLQDIGFTFHEARAHVIRALQPLLLALVEKFLPELLAQTIGHRILEEISPLAEMATDTPIQIVVSPANRAVLEPFLNGATTCPLELVEEPSLGPGQVYLRSAKSEKHIDLDGAARVISDALVVMDQNKSDVFAHG